MFENSIFLSWLFLLFESLWVFHWSESYSSEYFINFCVYSKNYNVYLSTAYLEPTFSTWSRVWCRRVWSSMYGAPDFSAAGFSYSFLAFSLLWYQLQITYDTSDFLFLGVSWAPSVCGFGSLSVIIISNIFVLYVPHLLRVLWREYHSSSFNLVAAENFPLFSPSFGLIYLLTHWLFAYLKYVHQFLQFFVNKFGILCFLVC